MTDENSFENLTVLKPKTCSFYAKVSFKFSQFWKLVEGEAK